MNSRNFLILASVTWSVACAQAESIGGISPSPSSGGSATSSGSGGASASSNGGQTSSNGGSSTSPGDTSASPGGTSSRSTAGGPGVAGNSGATGQETAGAAGKGGSSSSRGGTAGASIGSTSAAGRSAGGATAQTAGGTLGVAGATGVSSCLASAATSCESYCTGLNPGEDAYCDAVIQCWIENACDSTKACSLNNGPCSVNTQGHGATPWNKAVDTVKLCCP